ncbi:MAG: tRNA guanosine(34) transglycosylase Tgt [Gaiellales bacterium]|nr:tRNA guanosine(34) transglycosylase Tgt [Gaiellales bacterium]
MSLPIFPFTLEGTDGQARAGRLETPHGTALTPCFMPVGTKGTVKTMTPERLCVAGAQIILANTYHLALRPGAEVVAALGGLHRFMGWQGPILTDSGGFQVFSLLDTARVTDEGVSFRSIYDGSHQFFSPERSMEVQHSLGADIVMCFDECAPATATATQLEQAVERTGRWAARCREAHRRADGRGVDGPQMLLGIVQGGVDPALRRRSLEGLLALDFPGYAIGGLSVGEERSRMLHITSLCTGSLPAHRVRYFMGIGDPAGILEVISRGVDLFDCVLPTRTARMGTAWTARGRVNLRNAAHATSSEPLEEGCPCTACRTFSRGALRHFVMQKEILGLALLTEHNLTFLGRLVAGARTAILNGSFAAYKGEWTTAW